MKSLTSQLHRLQRRLGKREELIAGIVLALLAISAVSFTLTTHVGTPAGAALAYMAAVDRGDLDYVWAHTIIDSTATTPATVSLLNRAALAAQIKSTEHSRSAFDVQSVGFVTTGTRVTLTYQTSTGRESINLVMRGGAPHSWPVLVEPAGLDFGLPPGAGALSIDGQPLDAATGDVKAAVFPGRHAIALSASRLYLSYVGTVVAQSTLPSTTRVNFSEVKLTDEAVADARQVVSNAIKNCAASPDLKPSGCPQALAATDLATNGAKWSILGDPLAATTAGVSDKSELEVRGHYLMSLTYGSEVAHRTLVMAVGGPYAAVLKWDGNAMSVSSFASSPSATALPRPAATDAQVLSALKGQFDSCLKIQAGAADGCPQQVEALFASNFVWRSNSDPVQGASVSWDDSQGFFKVSGNFDFTVGYDSTPPYSPTRHYQDHSSGQYVADLYWDGSKLAFVGFEK